MGESAARPSPLHIRTSLVLLACVFASPVHAQNAPADVTDADIAKYKSTARAACTDAGKQKGDAPDVVDAACTCLLEYLDKTMTQSEWQRVAFYSSKNQAADEAGVITPHLKDFRGCAAPAPDSAASPTPVPSGAPGSALAPAKPAANAPRPGTGLRLPASK